MTAAFVIFWVCIAAVLIVLAHQTMEHMWWSLLMLWIFAGIAGCPAVAFDQAVQAYRIEPSLQFKECKP